MGFIDRQKPGRYSVRAFETLVIESKALHGSVCALGKSAQMFNRFFFHLTSITVMRPACGWHFSNKSAGCAVFGRLPDHRFTTSLPRGAQTIRLFFFGESRFLAGKQKTDPEMILTRLLMEAADDFGI